MKKPIPKSHGGKKMNEDEVIYADGFTEALMGHGYQFNHVVAVYDYDKCIDILMKEMSFEEAIEYFEYNVIGAYVGESTPVFFQKFEHYELEELDDVLDKVTLKYNNES